MGPESGRMLTSVWNQLTYFTLRLLPKQLNCEHSLMPRSTQQPGLWAAHRTRGVDVLAACYCTLAPRLSRRCIKRKRITSSIKNKQEGRKEGRKQFDSRRGKKEGGRKEGRQEARNNGLAPRCCVHLPIYTCYFQTAASSAQFTGFGFKMW